MKTFNFDHIREAVNCLQADAIDRGLTPIENAYICTNSDYESEWDIEPDSILLLTTFTDEWDNGVLNEITKDGRVLFVDDSVGFYDVKTIANNFTHIEI